MVRELEFSSKDPNLNIEEAIYIEWTRFFLMWATSSLTKFMSVGALKDRVSTVGKIVGTQDRKLKSSGHMYEKRGPPWIFDNVCFVAL